VEGLNDIFKEDEEGEMDGLKENVSGVLIRNVKSVFDGELATGCNVEVECIIVLQIKQFHNFLHVSPHKTIVAIMTKIS
jgi:hypothetical protein